MALPGAQLWRLDWVGSGTLINGTSDGILNFNSIRSSCCLECGAVFGSKML